MDELKPFARCNDCEATWPEDGSCECPHCGSDEISTFFVAGEDDE